MPILPIVLVVLASCLGGCASRSATVAGGEALLDLQPDGGSSLGGSALDKLSLRSNQETNLATSDPRFVDRPRRELFEADFARSQERTEARPVGWNDYIAEFIADQL
jgi:hypothetical protein